MSRSLWINHSVGVLSRYIPWSGPPAIRMASYFMPAESLSRTPSMQARSSSPLCMYMVNPRPIYTDNMPCLTCLNSRTPQQPRPVSRTNLHGAMLVSWTAPREAKTSGTPSWNRGSPPPQRAREPAGRGTQRPPQVAGRWHSPPLPPWPPKPGGDRALLPVARRPAPEKYRRVEESRWVRRRGGLLTSRTSRRGRGGRDRRP